MIEIKSVRVHGEHTSLVPGNSLKIRFYNLDSDGEKISGVLCARISKGKGITQSFFVPMSSIKRIDLKRSETPPKSSESNSAPKTPETRKKLSKAKRGASRAG